MYNQPNNSTHQSPAQVFGLIIPGKNVLTNFIHADAIGTKFTITLNFSCTTREDNPSSVHDLILFLLPNVNLPENTGATIYWSAAPIRSNISINTMNNNSAELGFELLGALTPTKTSGIFRTGWSSHEPLLSLLSSCSPSGGITITLGVSLEPLSNIGNLELGKGGVEDRKSVGKKIALDLFNFLQSFDDTSSNGNSSRPGWMMVPTNIFERWYKRFEGKVSRDPNFFMKNGDE